MTANFVVYNLSEFEGEWILITVKCSKILNLIITASDRVSSKQWVGAFKGDQWCFMRREDGKAAGKSIQQT